MFYKLMRNKNTDKYTAIYDYQILGNSGACVNSVYQAAFLSGLESRLSMIKQRRKTNSPKLMRITWYWSTFVLLTLCDYARKLQWFNNYLH